MFKPKELLLFAGCALAGGAFGWIWPKPTRLTFVNVGQGDCAIFETEGTVILFDSGPKTPTTDSGERIVVPRLRQMGVEGVDLILLSHPDMDHIGGAGAVVRAYPKTRIAASSYFRHNAQLLEQLRTWGRDPASVLWLNSELVGRVGSFDLRIDCPAITDGQETNDGSMFCKISEGAASAVLTGDAPAKDEQAIGEIGDWKAEIIKAGHHGSRTATSQDWLDHVHPEFAILSCGRGNRYGHPHKEVVDRLMDNRVKICRTDQEGDIVFTLQNGRFVRQ